MRLDNEYDDDDDGHNWKEFDFFLEERKIFIEDGYKTVGSLYLLPDCFYLPAEGEASNPSEELLDRASRKAGWLWGAEDHMQGVYEFAMWDSNWDRLNYEQPFRKFSLPGADFFAGECVGDTAHELARDGAYFDAFRIAARTVVHRAPASRDCLWYTLDQAENIISHEDFGDDYDPY